MDGADSVKVAPSAEQAGKLLKADIKNLEKKGAEGKPLTPAHRLEGPDGTA
jgi:hypothetical protein